MINWRDHIEYNEAILSGKPIIKQTRLSVTFIIERFADGWTEEEVLENYPSLTRESIQAIYGYMDSK